MIKIFFIFLVPVFATLQAAESAKQILSFADALSDSGDYYRAITEYKRALHYFPGYEKRDFIELEIGKLYFKGERFRQAQDYLIPLTASSSETVKQGAYGWLAMSYFYDAQYINSARLFADLSQEPGSERNLIEFQIMQALSTAGLGEFSKAREQMPAVEKSGVPDVYKPFLKKSGKILQEASELEKRSPFLAATSGIIFPGGGYFYNDDFSTGIVALLAVLATGYLSYDGFQRDAPVQGGIFLTIATSFYAGSIYGGYRQAKKWNANLGKAEFNSLLKEHRSLSLQISRSF